VEINPHLAGNRSLNPLQVNGTILLSIESKYLTMKDVMLLVGVFIAGYIVWMGVLYVAFRIFFPVVVEKDESEVDIRLRTRNPMKISRARVSGISPRLHRLHKIKLTHG
jgi:hypothetical protein